AQLQHGGIRGALYGSHGAARAGRYSTGAQADLRAPGFRPQHPAVRYEARSSRSPATGRAWRRAYPQHRRSVRRCDGQSCRGESRSSEMSTQSNAVPESSFQSQGIAPAAVSPFQTMYWSIRREIWENRSIYIAPLIAAALLLLG